MFEKQRRAERKERKHVEKEDFDIDIDLNLDDNINVDRDVRRKNNNDHVKISDGNEGKPMQQSRKRLDDLSDDLSSIPSYDDARMNDNMVDMDIDERDLDGLMFNPNNHQEEINEDHLNDTGQHSYFSSNINESSQTIDSDMMAAYQHAIQNNGGNLPADLQIINKNINIS